MEIVVQRFAHINITQWYLIRQTSHKKTAAKTWFKRYLIVNLRKGGGGKLKCALNDVINKPNIPNIACGEMTRVNGYAWRKIHSDVIWEGWVVCGWHTFWFGRQKSSVHIWYPFHLADVRVNRLTIFIFFGFCYIVLIMVYY